VTFAENLRRIRHEHFWSQAELSKRSGVSQQTIWRYELGKAAPLGRTVRALAEALGVEPRALADPSETAEVRARGKGAAAA
jgi:transcriptional regulator with XRE-family HTH domain